MGDLPRQTGMLEKIGVLLRAFLCRGRLPQTEDSAKLPRGPTASVQLASDAGGRRFSEGGSSSVSLTSQLDVS
jgi:hypothetical protein